MIFPPPTNFGWNLKESVPVSSNIYHFIHHYRCCSCWYLIRDCVLHRILKSKRCRENVKWNVCFLLHGTVSGLNSCCFDCCNAGWADLMTSGDLNQMLSMINDYRVQGMSAPWQIWCKYAGAVERRSLTVNHSTWFYRMSSLASSDVDEAS